MKRFMIVMTAIGLLSSVSLVNAEETKSGLQADELIGAFYVTKLAGAKSDRVNVGKNLCYRCKYGGRPQVMVFTRSSDKKVLELVRQLDAAISKNSDKQLRAFVNYLGETRTLAKEGAEGLAVASKVKNVPFVMPNEYENGPDDYGINPDAEVTIILAEGGKVKANHAAGSAKELEVDAVISDLGKILD